MNWLAQFFLIIGTLAIAVEGFMYIIDWITK